MAPAGDTTLVSTGPEFDNRRAAAALIDLMVPLILAALLGALGLALTFQMVLVVVGWTLFYFFALESEAGQTVGKRLMKIRVVRADGGAPSLAQIALRTLVRVVDGCLIGPIAMIATGNRRQRLGDLAAGTVVTRADAVAEELPAGATMDQTAAVPAAPALPEAPADEPKPAGRRLSMPRLGGPKLTMPKLAMPRLGGPKLTMPRLPFGRRRGEGTVTAAAVEAPNGPAPVPMPVADPDAPPHTEPESVPEVMPFDPFDEDAPEPVVEFLAPEHEFEDDGPEPEVELLDREPQVEYLSEDPDVEPRVEVLADEPEPELEPEPEPDPSRHTVKPIETISAIDFVMQDAEERADDADGADGPSRPSL